MADSATLLVNDILHEDPVRVRVPSFPYALRFLFATCPAAMSRAGSIQDKH